MSALPPKADMCALCQTHAPQQNGSLFDHLIGGSQQLGGNFNAERLGGLEIDRQFVLCGRLHRHVGRLLAFEDAVDITRRAPVRFDRVSPATAAKAVFLFQERARAVEPYAKLLKGR
jgi:hypothetical protein